ncbi:MAG: hypothetical protein COA42_22585 [Alteromonadaceae bacterium]|nr:MAG: hypothetical protein COA42_22585 [Alteromonadaceae bacterium]
MKTSTEIHILKTPLAIILWLIFSLNSHAQSLHIKHENPFGNRENNNIKQVIQDRHNHIWILGSAGLSRFNGSTFATLSPINSNKARLEYQFIIEDAQGTIWLATDDHLILLTDTGNNQYSINRRAIPGINALQSDPTTGVWVLSKDAVTHITANDIHVNRFHNSLHNGTNNSRYNSINDNTSFAVSRSNVYLTDRDGIRYLDINNPGTWQLIEMQRQPTALAYRHQSETLYVSDNQALHSIRNNKIVFVAKAPNKQNIQKLYIDTNDNLWSFSENNIWRIDPFGKIQKFPNESIRHPIINNILFSRESQLFIATKTGLSIIPNIDLKHLHPASSKYKKDNHNYIADTKAYYPGDLLTAEKIGHNTFALGGNQGLYYGNVSRMRHIKLLAKHRVHALHTDMYKQLWAATDRGLYKFDSNMHPVRFISNADMPSSPINSNVMHSDQNHLYIDTNSGESNGRIKIDLNINTKKTHLNISLKAFSSNGDNSRTDKINEPIPHSKNNIQFIFDEIYHIPLTGLNFQYYLEGYDKKWSPVTTLKSVNYAQLPPGHYKLRVRAKGKNALGEILHSPVESYNLRIAPPWWLSWWAKLGYTCALLITLITALEAIKSRTLKIKTDNNKLRKKIKSINENQNRPLLENNYANNKEKEKEKEANGRNSLFLAKLSHETHTPLNTIINLSKHLITSDHSTPDKRKIETICSTAENILHVTTTIFDISKIENNELQLEPSSFDLLKLLESTVKALTLNAKRKGLYLNTITDKNTEYDVQADKFRIHQILFNIITNAIKFTENGGITVNLKKSTLTNNKLNFHFSVRDTGVGIAPEDIDTIFNPFKQVGNNSKPNESHGSGLGLAISKKLVTMMDGTIHADSAPDRGSRFHFNLELAPADPREALNPQPHTNNTNGSTSIRQTQAKLKVLMAEDNHTNVVVVETYFKQHDLDLVSVGNGIEALEALNNNKFDIVLMDLEMPLMDGNECARRIRAGEAGQQHKNIPIIALSAHAMRTHKHQTKKSGIQYYLTKPVKFPLLFQYIQHCCDNFTHLPTTQRNLVTSIQEETESEVQENKERLRRQRFILVFLQESNSMLNEFYDAINSNDFALLEKTAHKYKSSAGMLQLNEILKLLKLIETKARAELMRDIEQSVLEIKQELDRIQLDIDEAKTGLS